MRFLVLSDLHSTVNHYFLEELSEKNRTEAVILLGDLTNFGPAEFLVDISTDKFPILALPGNCDPPEILNYFGKTSIINMHKNRINFNGLDITGLGGADFDFINMGIGYTDEEAYDFIVNNVDRDTILMLHQPPYGILDTVRNGHGGNRGIRRAVDEKRPRVVMSGHIHEERGKFVQNGTLFFNPGAAKDGYYAVFDTDKMEVYLMKR